MINELVLIETFNQYVSPDIKSTNKFVAHFLVCSGDKR